MGSRERELIAINTLDILAALGWQKLRILRRWAGLAFSYPARAFARQVLSFDREVAASGIRRAAHVLLDTYVASLTVRGEHRVPERGPVLFLSNHPGMTDTVALFAAIPRTDLQILAADRPFLRSLEAASRSLIFIPEDAAQRQTAVRRAVAHLRAGGALLTFPAGEIEPDPDVLSGAVAALDRWSASSALFVRLVPEATVLPVVVRGVLSRAAQAHPIARLRRRSEDRERLAAMLQIIAKILFPGAWLVRVRVDFLDPLRGREFVASGGAEAITAAIRDRVRSFLRSRARA